MLLQLAEKPSSVRVSSYTRKAKVKAHTRSFPSLREHAHIDTSDPYIFFPDGQGGGMFIHESKFDSVPEDTFKRLMIQLAPFQPSVQSGELSEPVFLADRNERRKERQEAKSRKREAKTQKKESKGSAQRERQERKKLKAESKAESRSKRAEAKLTKAQTGGGFDVSKLTDTASSLIGKFTGKGGDGGDIPTGTTPETSSSAWYKNPVVIVGGVALLGAGIYLATRTKK